MIGADDKSNKNIDIINDKNEFTIITKNLNIKNEKNQTPIFSVESTEYKKLENLLKNINEKHDNSNEKKLKNKMEKINDMKTHLKRKVNSLNNSDKKKSLNYSNNQNI